MNGRWKTTSMRRQWSKAGVCRALTFAGLLVAAWPGFAQSQLLLTSAEADPGATATLTLMAEGLDEAVAGIHVEFTVPDSLTLDSAVAGAGLAGFNSGSYTFNEGGATHGGFIAFSGNRMVDATQPLAVLQFTVSPTASAGSAAITFTRSTLSNVTGTNTVAHTTNGGAITIASGGGDTLAQIAQKLFDGFDTGDMNGDDALSFDEAVTVYPALTQTQFDALDSNSNGFVTLQELQDAGAMTPPPPLSCCDATKRLGIADFRNYLGDLGLLGLALGVLLGMGALTRKP